MSPIVAIPGASISVILKEIDNQLELNNARFSSVDVRSGLGGLSLYHFARGSFYNSTNDLAVANGLLEKCFNLVNEGYISGILYREISELGWLLEICRKTGQYTDDTNEVLNDIDEIMYSQLKDALETKNFDPATGALGFGFYFLQRVASQPAALSIVQELADALVDLSWKNENGLYWKSKLKDDDSVYLGISHGTAAIISFLVKAIEAGVEDNYSDTIREAARYVVNNEIEGPIFFPVIVGEGLHHVIHANNWCYGDPGTLYGLLRAAIYLEDATLKDYALKKFAAVTKRQNDNTYLIAGYGLLYGNAGLAMLYHKCYLLSGEQLFADAYDAQIELLQVNFNPCDKYLGYEGYWNQETEVTNYTFSEGMIGIALVLMAKEHPSFSQYYEPFFYL